MATVCQNLKQFLNNHSIIWHVELGSNCIISPYFFIKIVKAAKSNIHKLRFFMLNGENNRLKYCLEILDFETKQTSSAIAYNIFNKQEETFPELR